MPFLEATGGIGIIKTESNFTDNLFKSNIVQFGGGAGIVISLSNKVTFDVILNWSSFIFKGRVNNIPDLQTVNQIINFSTGFSIYLGS
ncbi:hypothetical protein [Maribacter antarcticus]|uniref:hypothetical protein n=1 Tax=Maribacter antarcticus TaxID=505250 RepID=UPI00047B7EBA|nr:hypothetical protein [Maribacter antarcticus]